MSQPRSRRRRLLSRPSDEEEGSHMDEENLSPHVQGFKKILVSSLDDACVSLRRAHFERDESLDYMYEVEEMILEAETLDCAAWDRFVESDLPMTLITMLRNKALAGYTSDELAANPGSNYTDYASSIVWTLAQLLYFVIVCADTDSRHEPLTKKLHKHILSVYGCFWSVREQLRSSMKDKDVDVEIFGAVSFLTDKYLLLHSFLFKAKLIPTDNRMTEVVLFCWANTLSHPITHTRLSQAYYAAVCPEERDLKLMVPVYDRVITGLEMGQNFLNAYKSAILNPRCLDNYLVCQLTLLNDMLWCQSSPLLAALDEEKVMTWVTAACRRNICSGGGKFTNTAIVRAIAVMHFLLAWWNRKQRRGCSFDVFFTNVDTFYIPQLVTRVLRFALSKDMHDVLDASIRFFRFYVNRLDERLTKECRPLPQTLLQNLCTEWLPILSELRQFRPPTRSSAIGSTFFWVKFGEKIGMKEGSPRQATSNEPLNLLHKGCWWRGCLCFGLGERLLGHPLRECKGCRNIWYCGSRCQTEDWKEHRKVCPGRRR